MYNITIKTLAERVLVEGPLGVMPYIPARGDDLIFTETKSGEQMVGPIQRVVHNMNDPKEVTLYITPRNYYPPLRETVDTFYADRGKYATIQAEATDNAEEDSDEEEEVEGLGFYAVPKQKQPSIMISTAEEDTNTYGPSWLLNPGIVIDPDYYKD